MRITARDTSARLGRRRRDDGFTLIELLVVVVVIGILAAIAIPVYLASQDSAKDSAVQSDLNNAKTAVVSYFTDKKGKYPAAVDAVTLKDYGYRGPSISYTATADQPKYIGTTPSDNATAFCLIAKSPTGIHFTVSESGGVKKGTTTPPGACL